eukprot:TRINITY_DN34036_c0_g1_i1.p1 TRINITY_DN34036_c0_g1~~TRINITY_DN34036_c0_g1_i1.p1  ORF type:complete len:795 (+),score=145.93 TRINITY_DN34036_c0_g1_i1:55-2439(+)
MYPVHESFARWAHQSTVIATLVHVLEDGEEKEKVIVATQSIAFVCEVSGEVRQMVKLANLRMLTVMGRQVVFVSEGSEDLHLILVEDSRNLTDGQQLPYILKELAEINGGSVEIREVEPEQDPVTVRTPSQMPVREIHVSPSATPEGYLDWLAEQREEGLRLSQELNNAMMGLGMQALTPPKKESLPTPLPPPPPPRPVSVGYEVPKIRDSDIATSQTTTPPPFSPACGGQIEEVWALFEAKLGQQGTKVDDLLSASDAALLGVFQELGFNALHCALLQSEWFKRRQEGSSRVPTSSRSTPWDMIDKMLKEMVTGGFVTLEAVDELPEPPNASAFNSKKQEANNETKLLWHTHEALAPVSGPLGRSVYFPITPVTADVLGDGLHELTLTEVVLGDVLNTTQANPTLSLQSSGHGSVKLTLPSEIVYAVQDLDRMKRKYRVAFYVDTCVGVTGVQEESESKLSTVLSTRRSLDAAVALVKRHTLEQQDMLGQYVAEAKAELDKYRIKAELELDMKAQQVTETLHGSRGRLLSVESALQQGLANLRSAVAGKDDPAIAAAYQDLRKAVADSQVALDTPKVMFPVVKTKPIPHDFLYFAESQTTVQLDDCAAGPVELAFDHDFDCNGVFHYLGTNGGREEFKNPHDRGLVGLRTAAGVHPRSNRDVTCITGRERGHFFMTPDCQNGWLEVELKSHKLRPSAYTLEHGVKGSDALSLRDWALEASHASDGPWHVLASHMDDTHLGTTSPSHTWVLAPGAGSDSFFSFFRIKSTGPCANSTSWSICLSGLEFYGSLVEA